MSEDQFLKEFDIQAGLKNKSRFFIIGVDEAGRGPLAGPVVACALCLKDNQLISKITDSKKMTLHQRQQAFDELQEKAWMATALVEANEIDRINILNATHLAMTKAIQRLEKILWADDQFLKGHTQGNSDLQNQILVLIDGNSYRGDIDFPVETIIKGDQKSLSIACASVIAKQTRDQIMNDYDQQYPQYGFKEHKGYPTKKHALAIKEFGFSPIHRQTFKVPYL